MWPGFNIIHIRLVHFAILIMIKTSTVVPWSAIGISKWRTFCFSFTIARDAAYCSTTNLYNGRDISNYLIEPLYFLQEEIETQSNKVTFTSNGTKLQNPGLPTYTGASASACIFIQVRQKRELELTRWLTQFTRLVIQK